MELFWVEVYVVVDQHVPQPDHLLKYFDLGLVEQSSLPENSRNVPVGLGGFRVLNFWEYELTALSKILWP
jgi:hypothetical protein